MKIKVKRSQLSKVFPIQDFPGWVHAANPSTKKIWVRSAPMPPWPKRGRHRGGAPRCSVGYGGMVVASGRTRRLVILCVFMSSCMISWGFLWFDDVYGGVGGVGGLGGWVGDVNVHWTCTPTQCDATARSLQVSHNFAMLRCGGVGGVGGGC